MRAFGAILLLLAVSVDPAVEAVAPSVRIKVVAIQATSEGREAKYFDPALTELREVLAGFDYDTFRRLKTVEADTGYGGECKVHVTERYTLFVAPLEKDSAGRIWVKVRVEEKFQSEEGPKTRIALNTKKVLMPPGKHVVLCGFKLAPGELVMLVSVGEKPHDSRA